jgi:hypothetical protein
VLAAFGHMLLPWQGPHLFLGTTNHARLGGLLFHGAGYNLSYFSFLVALALPWFAIAAMSRTRRVSAGLSGLLWPAFYIVQIAFYAAASAVAVLLCAGAAGAARGRARSGARSRMAGLLRSAGPLFAATSAVSALYFLRLRDVAGGSAMLTAAGQAFGRYIPRALLVLAAASVLLLTSLMALQMAARLSGAVPSRAKAWTRRAAFACLLALACFSALELAGRPGAERGAASGRKVADPATRWLARVEPARADMWTLGIGKVLDDYVVRGAGAGTWARFHKHADRRTRLYYAHMHNTALDMAFEYGLVPMMALSACVLLAVLRLAAARNFNRLWLYYLVPCFVMAMGQHLLYAFTNLCLLMPPAIVTFRVLCPNGRRGHGAQRGLSGGLLGWGGLGGVSGRGGRAASPGEARGGDHQGP